MLDENSRYLLVLLFVSGLLASAQIHEDKRKIENFERCAASSILQIAKWILIICVGFSVITIIALGRFDSGLLNGFAIWGAIQSLCAAYIMGYTANMPKKSKMEMKDDE